MIQVIYLQADDDLPAIHHLLQGTQARRVLLVVPKGCHALRQTLHVRMLRRFAADLALEVALVSRDSRTQQAAREEGMAVVATVRQGQRGYWRSSGPRRSAAAQAAAKRVHALQLGRGDVGYGDGLIVWLSRVLAVLLFLLLLALVAVIAVLVIPEARIVLTPYRQPANTTLDLRADPEVEKASLANLELPARILEVQVEQIGETATISKKDAPDAPAEGTVIFINQTAAPLEILPGTVVRTSAGTTVRFTTVTTATLAPAIGATAPASIRALEPGPVGNVAAATVNVVETTALRGKVRVTNERPTQGGGVKQVGVVTRVDMDRLKGDMLQQLGQQAYLELQGQLTEQEFMPAESLTVEILTEVYDQFLDAEADLLHLQMRVLASGTAVDRAPANLLAFEALRVQIPSTYELRSEEITFEVDEQVRMEGRSVLFSVAASAQLVADLDTGTVRSTVAGLPPDEAAALLAEGFPLGAPPEIELRPEWIRRWRWLDRIPRLPFRIQVLVIE